MAVAHEPDGKSNCSSTYMNFFLKKKPNYREY